MSSWSPGDQGSACLRHCHKSNNILLEVNLKTSLLMVGSDNILVYKSWILSSLLL